jgi:integrase
MILSQAVEQYILHKRSLGMGFRGEAVRLRAFVKAIGDCDMHLIEPAPVLRFLEGNGPLTTFWFSKYHTLKAFYRYAQARDYCASCPLPLSVPQKPEAFQPYIYTNQDIERLIDAADSRHRYRWLLEPHTMRTLLLLLYGTGLRITEALSSQRRPSSRAEPIPRMQPYNHRQTNRAGSVRSRPETPARALIGAWKPDKSSRSTTDATDRTGWLAPTRSSAHCASQPS